MTEQANAYAQNVRRMEPPYTEGKIQTAPVPSSPVRRLAPWLHADGRKKTTAELRAEVPSWSASDWEAYLTTLEGRRTEVLLDAAGEVEDLSNEDYARSYLDILHKGEHPRLSAHIAQILDTLSPRQRAILNMRFMEDMTLTAIADALGIKFQTVETHLARALRNLGSKLRRVGAGAV